MTPIYSVILDGSKDVIYDQGGENIVAIMLQDGIKLKNVQIIRNGDNRYRIYKKEPHGVLLLDYDCVPRRQRGRQGSVPFQGQLWKRSCVQETAETEVR